MSFVAVVPKEGAESAIAHGLEKEWAFEFKVETDGTLTASSDTVDVAAEFTKAGIAGVIDVTF